LPFVEQQTIFSKFTFTGDSGWTNVPTSTTSSAVNNVAVVTGIVLPLLRCPSDPRPSTVASGNNVPGNPQTCRNSYVAIAGAVNNLDGSGQFFESRNTNGNSWSADFGNTAWGGIIAPSFNKVTFGSITDGTSNTMMLSEVANYAYFSNGAKGNDGDVSVAVNGWLRGHSSGRDANGNLSGGNNSMDARGQMYVTIRYAINQTGFVKNTDCPFTNTVPPPAVCGVSDHQWSGEGANTPLMSAHSGGVNCVFGDGSVHFLTSSTDLITLARWATRDDGGVVVGPP
jgi:prepilin-type processing-associated H-X9-DG protein